MCAQLNYTLISAYTLVHLTTLFLTTFILLNVVLPLDLNTIVPLLPSWKFDVNDICLEIDDGLGWDDDWLQQCRKNFTYVKVGLGCFGLTLVAAQWWALVSVWRWGRQMQGHGSTESRTDVEKAPRPEKAESLYMGLEPKA